MILRHWLRVLAYIIPVASIFGVFVPRNRYVPPTGALRAEYRTFDQNAYDQLMGSMGFNNQPFQSPDVQQRPPQSPPTIVNNVVIQIFLTVKNRTTTFVTQTGQPVRGYPTSMLQQLKARQDKVPASGPPGSPTNPIIVRKEFDPVTHTFVDEDSSTGTIHNPADLVDVKAVIATAETSNMHQREIEDALHASIPVILERIKDMQRENQQGPQTVVSKATTTNQIVTSTIANRVPQLVEPWFTIPDHLENQMSPATTTEQQHNVSPEARTTTAQHHQVPQQPHVTEMPPATATEQQQQTVREDATTAGAQHPQMPQQPHVTEMPPATTTEQQQQTVREDATTAGAQHPQMPQQPHVTEMPPATATEQQQQTVREDATTAGAQHSQMPQQPLRTTAAPPQLPPTMPHSDDDTLFPMIEDAIKTDLEPHLTTTTTPRPVDKRIMDMVTTDVTGEDLEDLIKMGFHHATMTTQMPDDMIEKDLNKAIEEGFNEGTKTSPRTHEIESTTEEIPFETPKWPTGSTASTSATTLIPPTTTSEEQSTIEAAHPEATSEAVHVTTQEFRSTEATESAASLSPTTETGSETTNQPFSAFAFAEDVSSSPVVTKSASPVTTSPEGDWTTLPSATEGTTEAKELPTSEVAPTTTASKESSVAATTPEIATTLAPTGSTQAEPQSTAAAEPASTAGEELSTSTEPETTTPSTVACPTPNQPQEGEKKVDVLFLLDSSDSVNMSNFNRALKLISDTVNDFHAIGPDGTQVSLVQYNREPYLEFSLRKHTCKAWLVDDINDTTFIQGESRGENALEKVAKYGFSKRRGDRDDAENVLVIVTDGDTDGEVKVPLKVANKSGVTTLVIAGVHASKAYVMELASDKLENIFNLTEDAVLTKPLAERLANRIQQVGTESHTGTTGGPESGSTSVHEASTTPETAQTTASVAPESRSTVVSEQPASTVPSSAHETSATNAPESGPSLAPESGSTNVPEQLTSAGSDAESTVFSQAAQPAAPESAAAGSTNAPESRTSVIPEASSPHAIDSSAAESHDTGSTAGPEAGTTHETLTSASESGSTNRLDVGSTVISETGTTTVSSTTSHDTGLSTVPESRSTNVPESGSTPAENVDSALTVKPIEEPARPGSDFDIDIKCSLENFTAVIKVDRNFSGIVYMKGHSDDPDCSNKSTAEERFGENKTRTITLVGSFSKCSAGLKNETGRSAVNISATVIVQHHEFIQTADDRVYIVNCIIENPSTTGVVANINVERDFMVSKTLTLTAIPPNCTYTLRRDSPNGPILKSALIGQTVFHRWQCDGGEGANDFYGIHVHDCFAARNGNGRYALVNRTGCSTDEAILSQLTYYDDQLAAVAKSKVFNVDDVQRLIFQCSISLCIRDGDNCEGLTPPACAANASRDLIARRVRHNPYSSSLVHSRVSANLHLMPTIADALGNPDDGLDLFDAVGLVLKRNNVTQSSVGNSSTEIRSAAVAVPFSWPIVLVLSSMFLTILIVAAIIFMRKPQQSRSRSERIVKIYDNVDFEQDTDDGDPEAPAMFVWDNDPGAIDDHMMIREVDEEEYEEEQQPEDVQGIPSSSPAVRRAEAKERFPNSTLESIVEAPERHNE